MATIDGYTAVHGCIAPPGGQDTTADLGNGGCNVIAKDSGRVVGHWSPWDTAILALNR